jgi:hypothetical protein
VGRWLQDLAVLAIAAAPALAARAQEPAAPPRPGAITAEAPIVGGNAASAKQRAMDDAFRQAVERAFAVLLAEAGVSPSQPPSPGLMQLKSTFFSRAKRYIRGYRVLEETQDGGRVRLQIDAEVDEGLLRREIDRARGATPAATAAPAASAVSVVVVGATPEANMALARALGGAGVKAETPPLGPLDDGKARDLAVRNRASAVLTVSGTVTDDGAVRGTSKAATSCRLAVRVVPPAPAPASDRAAEARAFSDGADAARAECLARAAGDVARQTASSLAGGPVVGRDMRVVSLDLDLIEPAALPLVLQALRKVGSVSSAEVRRVTVGHVEIRAITRLAAPALVGAIARELGGAAEVAPGQASPERAAFQVRLAAPPPVAPAAPTPGAPPPPPGAP